MIPERSRHGIPASLGSPTPFRHWNVKAKRSRSAVEMVDKDKTFVERQHSQKCLLIHVGGKIIIHPAPLGENVIYNKTLIIAITNVIINELYCGQVGLG